MTKRRGDVEIILDGEGYTLTPSLLAMMEFEEKTGKDVFEVLKRTHEKQTVGIKDAVAAVWAGIRGGYTQENVRKAPSWERVVELVQAEGVSSPRLLLPVIQFLANGIASDAQIEEQERLAKKDAPGGETREPTPPGPSANTGA